MTSTTDPLNNTTTFTYDSAGNLATVEDPLGNTTRRIYDAVSRLTQQIDARGMPTSFAYDALNRTTQILDALNGLTRFTYDGNGNLLMVTDARNNATAYGYDSMDRLQTRTDPISATESFEYDGVGNLTRHTDRKGQVATFSYDGLNRRTGSTYADSSVSLAFDAVGRLTQAIDTIGGSVENTYDVLDRLATQTGTLGTISYQHDALGRRTEMTASGQASIGYIWDPASRLTQIAQGSQVVTFQYDIVGRRVRLTLPNQVSTEYQYDTTSRLTALIYRNSTGQLGDLTYTYDAVGNRTGIGGVFARILLPDPVASATYDATNRQLTFGGQTLGYDANGNLTSDATTTYTWDPRNRLMALTGPTTASFQYDPLGRRTQKTINAATTRFQYDRLNPTLELSDAGQGAATLTGLDLDQYLTRTDGNGVRALIVDALGSTLALTDPSGTAITAYSYEPFGQTEVAGIASANTHQYTGRENDGNGLYYYRARYLHPGLQRFISEDPLGLRGGDVNLYAFVRNNPVLNMDQLGLATFGVQIQLSGGAVGSGGSFSNGIVIDDRGQIGLIDTVGLGGAGQTTLTGVSAIGQVAGSNASMIQALEGAGASAEITVAAPVPVGGVVVPAAAQGGTFVGSGYTGFTGGLGVGTPGVALSGQGTYTRVRCIFNCMGKRKDPPFNPEFIMP